MAEHREPVGRFGIGGAGRHFAGQNIPDLIDGVEGLVLGGVRSEAAGVRGGDDIRTPGEEQRRLLVGRAPDIHGGAGDQLAVERILQGLLVHEVSARHVDEIGRLLHSCEGGGVHQVLGRLVGNDEVARLIGLADAPEDSRSEALFLHLLAVQTPAQQFAPPPLRHDYRVWQLKALLSSGGLLIFLACLLFAGKQFYDASRLDSERAAVQAQADSAAQRYAELARTFPPMPVDNDTLRQVINRYQAMERLPATPREFYLLLSRALEATPQVELETIAWQRGGPGADSNGSGSAGTTAPSEGDESALVRGSIPTGSQANPRQVLAVFERFLAALRQQPGLQVNVQQQPFDVESGKSLKGGSSSDDTPASTEPRHFVVQIVHRVMP